MPNNWNGIINYHSNDGVCPFLLQETKEDQQPIMLMLLLINIFNTHLEQALIISMFKYFRIYVKPKVIIQCLPGEYLYLSNVVGWSCVPFTPIHIGTRAVLAL